MSTPIKWDRLHEDYVLACMNYVKAFESLTGLKFDYWPADHVGTVASIGDYFVDMQDIVLVVDEKIPLSVFDEWYCKQLNDMGERCNLWYFWKSKQPAQATTR